MWSASKGLDCPRMKARTADAPCASSSCSSDKRTSSPLTKKSKALGGSAEPPQVLSSVHMFMQQEQCLQAPSEFREEALSVR